MKKQRINLNTKKKSITLDTPITEIAFAYSIKKGHKGHKKSTACIPRINDDEHSLMKLHYSFVQTVMGSLSHIITLLNFNGHVDRLYSKSTEFQKFQIFQICLFHSATARRELNNFQVRNWCFLSFFLSK